MIINISVSPGLNEVRGAHGSHDDEQQSVRSGARREARVTTRASRRTPHDARREKAHVATCVQTPQIKNSKLHN